MVAHLNYTDTLACYLDAATKCAMSDKLIVWRFDPSPLPSLLYNFNFGHYCLDGNVTFISQSLQRRETLHSIMRVTNLAHLDDFLKLDNHCRTAT